MTKRPRGGTRSRRTSPCRACPCRVNDSAGDLDGKRQGWLRAASAPVREGQAGRWWEGCACSVGGVIPTSLETVGIVLELGKLR